MHGLELPAVCGALMLLGGYVAGLVYLQRRERRRFRCDGCRQEALGSSMPFLRHTCSRGHAHYSDRRGIIHEFGRRSQFSALKK